MIMRYASCLTLAAIFCFSSAVYAGEAGITPERAREIALAQTGAGDVMELDRHQGRGGRDYFRLEILTDDGAYHVEIDANSGRLMQLIRKHDGGRRDREQLPASPAAAGSELDYGQALELALKQTGGGTLVESDTDRKRSGRIVYEFEIINNNTWYQLDIDSTTGQITDYRERSGRSHAYAAQARLGATEAQKIALDRSSGGVIHEYKLERDDGRLVHEIDIRKDGRRYEMEIDDATGEIVEYSVK